MRRAATGLIISLAAVAVVLPAGAANLRLARGSLTAMSSTSVSVTTAKGTVSCKLGSKSPSNAGFVRGERVQIACRRAKGHWLLTTLRHAGTTAAAADRRYAPTRPAAIFGQTRPQQGKSIFGEDLISDKSLDEVILSYLAEDLDEKK